MRISKILALGLVAACAIASPANAGSRDRNPNNGDELIGYVDGGNGGGAELMTGVASIAANMFGVRIPGMSTQSAQRYQPQYQEYGGYQRDPGAPAYDLYADCRYRGQVDGNCVRRVNAKLSQAARASGETFICKDRYGDLVRTQNYSYGCRLESKMTNF
ncbi:hypothetical protein [Rhizobium sp. MHM7A]|uniref:hypothetical protein n=1 Tax=Rhizobium sp. MHM7A TaxID=2583233 RepID=UPI00110759FD|nr:hypothetical protein [Rhizobium sp. MHM7A]TLX16557.1 hypothetical protein FFR93_04255 [Rhizobium sp. MHM7A]